MAQVWMYALGASSDPDCVRCEVPWRVDEKLIFFGPCMPDIRKRLRGIFLRPDCSRNTVTEDLFIVGVNAIKEVKKRKIVWWGRLSEVMTFAEADRRLSGDRFKKLREHKCSPLHVQPVVEAGELVGYKHVSKLHKDEDKGNVPKWVKDLVSDWPNPHVFWDGQKLKRRHGTTPWQTFDRDCCMLLENRFFALGKGIQPGIEFDKEALDILREAQHKKSHIDDPAIFGRDDNGKIIGLRRWGLKIPANLTSRFVAWLEGCTPEGVTHHRSEGYGPAKTCCT